MSEENKTEEIVEKTQPADVSEDKDEDTDEYEKVCCICRRPES